MSSRLAHHGARILVIPKSEVRGVPQRAVAGPLRELDLGDERRLQPVRVPHDQARRWRIERAVLGGERREEREEPVELPVAEPCADLARELEPALVVVAHEQAADGAVAASLARLPAT